MGRARRGYDGLAAEIEPTHIVRRGRPQRRTGRITLYAENRNGNLDKTPSQKRQSEVEPKGVVRIESEAKQVAAVERVAAVAAKLALTGTVSAFGSHVNGLSTNESDCDLTYIPEDGEAGESPARVLQMFADELPKHCFRDVVVIFQATVPLVKAVDPDGTEVDLCVGNYLGRQNSKLVSAYCSLDPRVSMLGKLVKKWAKAFDLVGCVDGHLNSYAYTLVTIYYLMNTNPPVIPNLQDLACGCEPVPITDKKWGTETQWDCKFWENTDLIPRSSNCESVDSLLRGFFWYYTSQFDWSRDVVSIRLALTPYSFTPKFELYAPISEDQWYIEDPFDLRHNVASQCTKWGRLRILERMLEASRLLDESQCDAADLFAHISESTRTRFLLKCRLHADKASVDEFVQLLRKQKGLGALSVNFPSSPFCQPVFDAFIVFRDEGDRRKIHALNETYIRDWQLRLLPCGAALLDDALETCGFDAIEVLPAEDDQVINDTNDTNEESEANDEPSQIRGLDLVDLYRQNTEKPNDSEAFARIDREKHIFTFQ